jgi:hypothetical protein
MGVTSNPNMLFDLANLIIPSEELQHLEAPFQQDEIDQVVKKKCLQIRRQDRTASMGSL